MLTIQSASNPYYLDETGFAIHLTVKFAEYTEPLGFCAMPNDSMSYGIELFNRAKAGEFGVIGAYEPPKQEAAPDQPQTQGAQTL